MLTASVLTSERGALPTAIGDRNTSARSAGLQKKTTQSWKPIKDKPSRFTLLGWHEMAPEFRRKQSRLDFQKAAVSSSPIVGTSVGAPTKSGEAETEAQELMALVRSKISEMRPSGDCSRPDDWERYCHIVEERLKDFDLVEGPSDEYTVKVQWQKLLETARIGKAAVSKETAAKKAAEDKLKEEADAQAKNDVEGKVKKVSEEKAERAWKKADEKERQKAKEEKQVEGMSTLQRIQLKEDKVRARMPIRSACISPSPTPEREPKALDSSSEPSPTAEREASALDSASEPSPMPEREAKALNSFSEPSPTAEGDAKALDAARTALQPSRRDVSSASSANQRGHGVPQAADAAAQMVDGAKLTAEEIAVVTRWRELDQAALRQKLSLIFAQAGAGQLQFVDNDGDEALRPMKRARGAEKCTP